MIHYILQTVAFQLLFLVVYDLFLKKETFFNYNRVYLLLSPLLSFVLPLIQINALKQQIPSEYYVQLPTVLLGDISTVSSGITTTAIASESISVFQILSIIWVVGLTISVLIFGIKAYKIYRLKQLATLKSMDGISFYEIPGTDTAFTFLKTIFLGAALSEIQQKSILLHEQVHVKENHFADLLFFELLRMVCWFNPLVYIFQQRVSVLQEYKADAVVIKQQSKQEYYHNLLSQVFSVDHISFINTFFNHSLLKKRIVMLQKSKSKRIFQLKYLLLVPVVFGMLLYASCTNEGSKEVTQDDTEVMQKINELSEAIMKKGNISDEEMKALKFLSAEAKEGDKIYVSVQEYLDDPDAKEYTTTVVETQEIEGIPFSLLDKAPVFPGCEGMSAEDNKVCFTTMINEHIAANFNTKLSEELGLSGRQRITTVFKISQKGMVEGIQVNAPHPNLEAEAKRVLLMLPKMEPGEAKGKRVNVLYNLPILFEINE
ncbi:M56 family metallopeptidase [Jejudonia soesokkakensis]|uniref:M56 family metallopeptidase n=1 Tax=Jejudonia soesokkakensis TaxID=1323432 RepID=A0ABW2MQR8_9FLAO